MLGSPQLLARAGSSCGSISLSLLMCTQFCPRSSSLASPGTAGGAELLCCLPAPLLHRISRWLDSVLCCGHRYSSPSGQRQLSTHSHEFHTHAMQSLGMCQLDNVTSKARIQKWAMGRMSKLKGLIYRNIIRRRFFCFLLKFVLKNRIT